MYFDPLKSMSEIVRLSSVDLGRQAVVMFLVKKSDKRYEKYFIVVHTLVLSWLGTNKNGEPIS